jgi:hypothetical protein
MLTIAEIVAVARAGMLRFSVEAFFLAAIHPSFSIYQKR